MRFADLDTNSPFIRKDNLRLLFSKIKDNSYSQNIKNWIKSRKLIPLKRGLYVLAAYWEKCQDKDRYLDYLSSIIYYPSYVSKETTLARYGMLSETVFGISAVSLKTSRSFSAQIALFSYTNIKESLFTGFQAQYYGKNRYYAATKSKALFDYLYFYKRKMPAVNLSAIQALRLNLGTMTNSDWEEFQKYLAGAKSVKMDKLYKLIREQK